MRNTMALASPIELRIVTQEVTINLQTSYQEITIRDTLTGLGSGSSEDRISSSFPRIDCQALTSK